MYAVSRFDYKKRLSEVKKMSRADHIELGKELFKYSVKNARPFASCTIDTKVKELTFNGELDPYDAGIKVLNDFIKSYNIFWEELL